MSIKDQITLDSHHSLMVAAKDSLLRFCRLRVVDPKELAWLVLDVECNNHNRCSHSELGLVRGLIFPFDIDEVVQDLASQRHWTLRVSEANGHSAYQRMMGVKWLCPKCSDPEWQPPEGFLKSEAGE